MKTRARRILFTLVFGIGMVGLTSCGGDHKVADPTQPNLLTFSRIDLVPENITGRGVKIAVLDWQFDLSGSKAGKYIDPVSMVPGEAIGELEPWHGEWMAEIVHTIAPDVEIIPIRARKLGSEDYEDYLIAGIRYAADHGATAVTSSMGPLSQSAALDSVIAYAEERGTIFIDVHPETVKTANGEIRECAPNECCKLIIHPGVVSVPDHHAQPEPNRDIYTWPYDLEANYKDGWGYSNAPPIVAGVIALMKSANPALTTDDIRRLVKETAFEYQGFRCIDAEAAVKAALSQKPADH